MILFLPWPPSVNTYWRHPTKGKLAGRHLISAEGRSYRKAVIAAVLEQFKTFPNPMLEDLSVYISVCPPDKRKRDLDNLLKSIFDSLTHAGVWRDDSQVVKFTVERHCTPVIEVTDKSVSCAHLRSGSICISIEPYAK